MKEEVILQIIDSNQKIIKVMGDELVALQNKVQAMQNLLVDNDKKVNELWLNRGQ